MISITFIIFNHNYLRYDNPPLLLVDFSPSQLSWPRCHPLCSPICCAPDDDDDDNDNDNDGVFIINILFRQAQKKNDCPRDDGSLRRV